MANTKAIAAPEQPVEKDIRQQKSTQKMAVGRDLLRRCTRLNVKDDGVPSELRLTSYNTGSM